MAVNMDFRVKNGLAVTTTATVEGTLQSTSTNSGALTVAGGVGIGGNLNVNNSATILSTAFNTGTLSANALYVAGGVGIGKTLLVTGDAIFQSSVTFSGTSTYIFSTNTVYTDNLINLHVPAGDISAEHSWTVDDGKDIGHIYHYYSGTDKDAFLGLSNNSGYLEWYSNSVENNGIVSSATYGTFKTGSIILTDTTASTTTGTGALTVAGGVGIGGDLRVGGTIFGVANVTGVITTATNIANGTAGQLVYQSAAGVTAFAGPGTAGQVLVSNGTSAPVYQSNVSLNIVTATSIVVTSTQSSTSSFSANALYVTGGIGGNSGFNINGDSYITGDLTVFGSITGTNVTVLEFTATSGVFYGDATGNGALYAGVVGYTPFPQTMIQATGNYNGYMEINVQNINAGAQASTDVIASADNVTASSAYIDMGITGSGWDGSQPFSLGTTLGPNDGYLMMGQDVVAGRGNLVIGTTTTGTNITFVVAGVDPVVPSMIVMTLNSATTPSNSTQTGALIVNGGVGIGQNLYVGGNEVVLGDIEVRGGDIITNQATFNLLNSTATTINFAGSGTAITIGATTGYTAIRNATTITNTTSATSTSTGALRVYGGVGIGGNLYVGGSIVSPGGITGIISTATNIAGGRPGLIPIQSAIGITSFINTGSVGTVLQMQVGNTATFVSTSTLQVGYSVTATNISTGTAGQLIYQSAPGITAFINTGAVGTVLISNGTSSPAYQNTLTLAGTTNATSTTTGALQVVGGVGIGSDLRVGGTIYGTISGSVTGIASTATNLAGGQSGYIPIQSAPGVTTFISTATLQVGYAITATNIAAGTAGQLNYQSAPGITGFAGPGTTGQLLMSSGTSAPVYVNTASIVVGRSIYSNTATNIAAGATGSLPYQSGTGTTAMLALSTAGYVLVAGATAPQWTSLVAITSNTATNIAGGLAGQIHYQSAPGVTSFITTGTAGTVLVSNGSASPVYQNTLTLAGTATSISTTTGALQVAGGIGVGDSIYVENRVGFVNTSNVSVVYQFYNAATNSLDTVFG